MKTFSKLRLDASASPRRAPDRPLLAFFWMVLSALGFSAMSVFVKRLAPVIPQFELVFFRSIVNCVIIVGVMLWRQESFFPAEKRLLIFRGLAGFGGVSCLFYAIGRLPLSIASMLSWCSPLFVLLFSRLFTQERVARRALLWIAVVFLGLVLLLKPDFGPFAGILGPSGRDSTQPLGLASSAVLTALPLGAIAIAILGSAFGGLAYVAVRAATGRVGVNVIVFYFTAIATFLSAPMAARNFHVPDPAELTQLVALGLFATLGQIAMTQGYRYAAAGLVSTMSLMGAAFSAFFGWILFSETLAMVQWLGMAFMGFGIAAVTLLAGKGAVQNQEPHPLG